MGERALGTVMAARWWSTDVWCWVVLLLFSSLFNGIFGHFVWVAFDLRM